MALTKIINDQSKSYRPVLTDKLVLDSVPTVNSFNGVTSDAVARAIGGASGEVPQVTEVDNGKVLTAVYDAGGPAVEWAEASGSDYSAGDGISIANDTISTKVDGTTIVVNASGELEANIPTPDTVDQSYDASSTHAQSGTAVADALSLLATVASTGNYQDLTNTPVFGTTSI